MLTFLPHLSEIVFWIYRTPTRSILVSFNQKTKQNCQQQQKKKTLKLKSAPVLFRRKCAQTHTLTQLSNTHLALVFGCNTFWLRTRGCVLSAVFTVASLAILLILSYSSVPQMTTTSPHHIIGRVLRVVARAKPERHCESKNAAMEKQGVRSRRLVKVCDIREVSERKHAHRLQHHANKKQTKGARHSGSHRSFAMFPSL